MISINKKAYTENSNLVLLANKNSSLEDIGGITSAYLSKKAKEDKNGLAGTSLNDRLVYVAYVNKTDKLSSTDILQEYRVLGSTLAKNANSEKLASVSVLADTTISADEVIAFLEGIALENYQFLAYKSKKEPHALQELNVAANQVSEAGLTELSNVIEATYFARDLVNEPVITLNAQQLSHRLIEAGPIAGYTTDILNKAGIEELNMGGLLGVNKGSIDPPTFNILEYKPENATNDKPLVFVGKGVVYDTGGNNLKTGAYMATMKCDMAGGAGVAGAIYAIAKNKLPIHVIALIPATDNRIGKNALVADDVITISDGTTVEVKNTDAEGRLILSDALVYAKKLNPMLVIDMATLTGAAEAITGTYGIATVGTANDDLKNKLKASGEKTYERLLELPMWKEYDDQLKSDIADMSNLGGRIGGAITAGIFLRHFTDYPWIHLDIAGPAFLEKAESYKPAGGTGSGARLLYEFAKNLAG